MNTDKKIYLDHAATTAVDAQVFETMLPYFSEKFGNASSVHAFGQEARGAVDNSRHEIAAFLNCKSTEIIFTSGGSEADNLAIRGVVDAVISNQFSVFSQNRQPTTDNGQLLFRISSPQLSNIMQFWKPLKNSNLTGESKLLLSNQIKMV